MVIRVFGYSCIRFREAECGVAGCGVAELRSCGVAELRVAGGVVVGLRGAEVRGVEVRVAEMREVRVAEMREVRVAEVRVAEWGVTELRDASTRCEFLQLTPSGGDMILAIKKVKLKPPAGVTF